GLSIEADRGRGYRLVDPVQFYDADKLAAALSVAAAKAIGPILIEQQIESTNLACLQAIAKSSVSLSGTLQLAERQSGGRGRRGKLWVSPPGSNIYCSLVWRFEAGASALSGLSLVVGLALSTALEKKGFDDIALKWPNDLLWQNRKLAGILIEVAGDVTGACDVVIGFGLNVAMPQSSSQEIEQPWVDLATMSPGDPLDKNEILAAILNELVDALLAFTQHGFASFLDRWRARDAFDAALVRLIMGAHGQAGEQLNGIYRGVNPDGSITLDIDGVLRQFSGGELSLRKR
ncbi:MAG: biotin--[acetyl-CoA-carboxylase] ligase, partial [Pseudomonadales bacterium]|nr:biotin--[acetyl-CoA-carboxylase] ligase [Pseudomonadales bacterium]